MIKQILKANLLAAACAVIVVSCAKPVEQTETNNPSFSVSKLFTHEGCTVYRFYDFGYYRYYVNCSGSVISSVTERCGDECSRTIDASIPTVITE
jgi:hypothetical protein